MDKEEIPLMLVGPEISAFLRLKRLMTEIGLIEANAPPDAVIDIAESLMYGDTEKLQVALEKIREFRRQEMVFNVEFIDVDPISMMQAQSRLNRSKTRTSCKSATNSVIQAQQAAQLVPPSNVKRNDLQIVNDIKIVDYIGLMKP